MSIEYWPFYPDKLTDVMGPMKKQREIATELFSFIQAGSAINLQRPVEIKEKSDKNDMKLIPNTKIVNIFKNLNFCTYIQTEKDKNGKLKCPGGFEKCEIWDRNKVAKKERNYYYYYNQIKKGRKTVLTMGSTVEFPIQYCYIKEKKRESE